MQVIDYQYYSCLILGGTANCNNQFFLIMGNQENHVNQGLF